jgi:BioD-like phosphotransacetylase family protein
MICTLPGRNRHYELGETVLVATGLNRFLFRVTKLQTNRPLFVTHCSRSDIILGFAAHTHKMELEGKPFQGALILSGPTPDKLNDYIFNMIKTYDLPAMHVPMSTANIVGRLQGFVSKLNIDDPARVSKAISHYERHIDFDTLLAR